MRKSIIVGGLFAALSLSGVAVAPTPAAAACSGATTGTIVGGVGGALIGNSISRGGGGALLGGLGGAVVGHEIGKSSCGHSTRRTRYHHRTRRSAGYDYRRSGSVSYSGYGAGGCRTETRSFYDQYGQLVQRATRICD